MNMLIPTSLCNTKITRFSFTPILRNSFSHSHAGTRSFKIHASPSEVDAQAQKVWTWSEWGEMWEVWVWERKEMDVEVWAMFNLLRREKKGAMERKRKIRRSRVLWGRRGAFYRVYLAATLAPTNHSSPDKCPGHVQCT